MGKAQRPPKGIVFDLDGTLLRSTHAYLSAANRLADECKRPRLSAREARRLLADGAIPIIERATGNSEEYQDRFWDLVDREFKHLRTLYDGVTQMLATLNGQYKLGLFTNKDQDIATKLSKDLGLDKYLDPCLGKGPVAKKPSPQGLEHIAREWMIRTRYILMIGDTKQDVNAARRAGCRMVLAAWGYGAETLHTGRIDARLYSPRDIVPYLNKLTARR